MDSFWHCFVGEKNDYYTLFIVLLFFEFGIISDAQRYACIGNAVNSKVVKVIFDKLRDVLIDNVSDFLF